MVAVEQHDATEVDPGRAWNMFESKTNNDECSGLLLLLINKRCAIASY